jgi:hypothetical protein
MNDFALTITFIVLALLVVFGDMAWHPGEDDMDTMKCPICKQPVNREGHENKFICKCGWKSR